MSARVSNVNSCLLIYILYRSYSLIFTHIPSYSLIFTHICAYLLIFAHIRSYSLVFAHIRSYLLIFAHMHSYSLICTHIRSYALIFNVTITFDNFKDFRPHRRQDGLEMASDLVLNCNRKNRFAKFILSHFRLHRSTKVPADNSCHPPMKKLNSFFILKGLHTIF
jgi:hypothetical protein